MDVTVTRRRFGRFDADGHNRLALRGHIKCVAQNLLEFFRVGNDVVGGQNRHHAGRRTRADQRRAERDGGASVAANRFGDQITFGDFRQLFSHFRQLRLVGDDENVFRRHERQHALDGFLQKGFFAEQREQLLGHLLAAQRPETFAAPARHDDDETVFNVSFAFHLLSRKKHPGKGWSAF